MCMVSFSRTNRYSGLKKLQSSVRPAWAFVVICDNCTHKCPWCYGEFDLGLDNVMSFEAFQTVTAKLKEMGTLQLSLAGGEPTEHPEFRRFVAYASGLGFLLHVVTHGEHIDLDMARFLKSHDVDQVQINWQGSRYHDRVHGVAGSYAKAVEAIRALRLMDIEVAVTITVGKYNLPHVDEIMQEAVALDVTRVRVWEATGFGSPWRKEIDPVSIFTRCREAAARLGYEHCLSYDPDYPGDVTVSCPQFSDIYMYINSNAKLDFCGVVPNTIEIADFLDPALNGEAIRELYLRRNRELLGGRAPFCVAREGFDKQGIRVKPLKWFGRSNQLA